MIARDVTQADVKRGFSCGVATLDAYFRQHAYPNHLVGISRCSVLPHPDQDDVIIGYYTLAAKSVEAGTIGPHVPVARMPRYPLGVVYIGCFAIDQRFQGQGFGTHLMAHALATSADVMPSIGAVGVYLDAHDQRARLFYLRHSFVDLEPQGEAPHPMLLPRDTLQTALRP